MEKGGFPHCDRIFISVVVVEKKVKMENGKLKKVEKLPQVCLKKWLKTAKDIISRCF
jgi:hypothetical protein